MPENIEPRITGERSKPNFGTALPVRHLLLSLSSIAAVAMGYYMGSLVPGEELSRLWQELSKPVQTQLIPPSKQIPIPLDEIDSPYSRIYGNSGIPIPPAYYPPIPTATPYRSGLGPTSKTPLPLSVHSKNNP